MENIILVYELNPENTRIYHLIVDSETAEKIKAAHLKFVNANDDGPAEWLSEYIVDKEFLVQAEQDLTLPPELSVDQFTIVLSGFIL